MNREKEHVHTQDSTNLILKDYLSCSRKISSDLIYTYTFIPKFDSQGFMHMKA